MDTPTLNPSPIKEGGTLTAQASPSLILGRGMGEMSSIFTTPAYHTIEFVDFEFCELR